MKKYSAIAALITGLLVSTPTTAQEYMFTYSKLFSQIKNNAKEGHQDVKVGIFFVDAQNKGLCRLEKAWMEKEEHYEEFDVSGYELKVPLDNNLRSANPLVFVQTERDKRCDYSLVVMAKEPLSGKVDYAQMAPLLPQMQVMLEDLGGMFASWFTPDVEGLTLEFDPSVTAPIQVSNGDTIPVENGRAYLNLANLKEGDSVVLPGTTTRILPYLPGAK
ncbi:DUF2987 domain-containing protein [Vibrio sp. SCSIO 43136]|uniref:DUF2987 domain-containing protein n=1 Tax=Vibrio sp. SCSIO 43136 TaxID=2819101 RepID=UPI00207550FD|nr:DUF2987 domain-containing protein [Vibrio sp. SCSIO 43136]USD66555.1 DUF2987 domain-containing protein [Vibrio sp. SCSIO 43136]